jgi:hypothetical protein
MRQCALLEPTTGIATVPRSTWAKPQAVSCQHTVGHAPQLLDLHQDVAVSLLLAPLSTTASAAATQHVLGPAQGEAAAREAAAAAAVAVVCCILQGRGKGGGRVSECLREREGGKEGGREG